MPASKITPINFLTILGFAMTLHSEAIPQTQARGTLLKSGSSSSGTGSIYDICIYGGTSAGVIAAYTAKKMNKTVILVEPGHHLGGLTAGGLGYTDIGNKYAITGLSRNFYRRVGHYYKRLEQWIFEPHVAEAIFNQYRDEAGVPVLFGYQLSGVEKKDGVITQIRLESSYSQDPQAPDLQGPASPQAPTPQAPALKSPTLQGPASASQTPISLPGSGRLIRAKMFIDCSYEGDLMARAGVAYTVGRESNAVYKETYNGIQIRDKHQFPDGIDPYKIPGDSSSGLLWGISPQTPGTTGEGDDKVQSYNFRVCLTDDPSNRTPIEKPANYDPVRYELLLRYLRKKPAKDLEGFMNISRLPHHKTDINNNGPFSTDMIGMNYEYPEAGYRQRAQIAQAHAEYVKGFFYFIGHDERMPEYLRSMMLKWGYPKDEYPDNGHWSPQMYVREARRMVGEYTMTQANCEGNQAVTDGIGLAAYTMDSHNCQRMVFNGMVKNEGDVQVGGFPPYPISYRAIIPKAADCKNLLVPVCLSASHIAYGSIRMEPVFMELGQSSAIAALLALKRNSSVQQVNAEEIRQVLLNNPLADNSTPEILVDNDDTADIRVKGNWMTEKHECYGFSKLIDDHAAGQFRSVRFTPSVKRSGNYSLYIYVPKTKDASSVTPVTVHGNHMTKTVRVRTGSLEVQGQTSGEWVPAGKYAFRKGRENYVEISNRNADGIIIADAILLVPDFPG